MNNIGHLYYKEYYKELSFDKNLKPNLAFDLRKLFDLKLDDYSKPGHVMPGNSTFELITTYPGMLIGSGYNHEIGGKELEGELKLGFFFDYTTGLPCIPGSSVKGVLRDACKKAKGGYAWSIIEELASGERSAQENIDEIKKLAKEFTEKHKNYFFPLDDNKAISDKNPSHFINVIFNGIGLDGERLPWKKRDIFFDAFPFDSFNEEGKFLANDYITHHEKPLKNPNPVQFLKVLPQVVFCFDFLLSENDVMNKELKLELFRQILLDLGAGAKTNVGYGQFIPYDRNKTAEQNKEEITGNSSRNRDKKRDSKFNIDVNLNKNDKFKATVTEESKDYYHFQFEVEENLCTARKKRKGANKRFENELRKDDVVLIVVNQDFKRGDDDFQFLVFPDD